MEANGSQQPLHRPPLNVVDHESHQQPSDPARKKGGWITFPFLAVAMMGLGVATSGALSNLVVYLIKEYNVPSVDAAQISNIVSGCLSVAPVAGAIVADAFFGCYPIVAVSMFFSVLALVVFTLTASLRGLQPAPCPLGAGPCEPASAGQIAALYAGVFLMCVSAAGSRFNQATMGADQFDSTADRDVLFNWFFIFFYASNVLGSTVIVYVQDTVSWTLGFGISGAASVVGLAALLLGSRYYRRPAVRGSPFTGLARVAVAAARKRKVNVATSGKLRFYQGRCCGDSDGKTSGTNLAPSDSFSFLNRAALITDGDIITADGSVARPWLICTVQQVEDFKTVLRILPLWSAAIFLSVAIGVQINFTILQALAMDRTVGRFTVPAGSMIVGCLIAGVISLGLLDRVLLPLWQRLTGHNLTPLQRIGAGHVLTVVSMAASAAIERRRLATVHEHGEEGNPGWVSPLSVMWLVLPFALSGAGEALHFPGQVTLYYQEFPPSLKNTATGMVSMIIALGFYLSTALVGIVRHTTAWLPDNMNASRMENFYWLLAVLVAVNFGYYLLCARFYKYQNIGK
ncbi:protein NRT1/ PTR FAMILY 2.3-like [Phragmites australis]|uniref:protein NRT1/ PTR FAMILY 2.3-like n=1 Tax=Phragmites australis TaxID=29695 RepID=UPI002D784438|nr:protein NRT1/ PTR FAMILY 2.3-like [Phragmites australis]